MIRTTITDGAAERGTVAGVSAVWALTGLSLSMALSSLGTSIANVALPTLAHSFGASFQDVQWVVLAYLVSITALIVGAGRLGDLIGRRRMLLSGLFLFTAASVLCGSASSLWVLVAGRAAQGAGAAVMMALTLAFVGEAVPKEKTGAAMGLLGTMSAIGTALGPTLGGVLIGAIGWPAIFLINLPLGVLALVLAGRFLPPDRARPGNAAPRFDLSGMLLLALTLIAYALAMTWGRGAFGVLNLSLLAAAIVGALVFVLVEARTSAPLVRLGLFRNATLSTGFTTSALVTTVVMATLVVGPFHLSGALGLDAVHVGLVMSLGPIVAALVGVPAGRIVDRHGARRTILAGLTAMAVGCIALSTMPIGFGPWGYAVPLAVVTAGYALFQAANNTAVMVDVAQDQRGVVSGLLNLSRNLGLVTGASVMGAIFALGSAASDLAATPAESVAAGTRATFAAATVLVGISLALGWGRRTNATSGPAPAAERH